jgi:hypothetical protein
LIEPAPEYVIEITLARIEYVKSVAALAVNSDGPKLICLLFFTALVRTLPNLRASRQAVSACVFRNRVLKTL